MENKERLLSSWPVRRLCLTTATVIVGLLFYLGAQPFAAGLIPGPWDKLAHFSVFATIVGLLWVATAGRMPLLLISAGAIIGALDEWHQARLPGRTMDLSDFLTDLAAAGITVFVLHATQPRTG